MATATAAATRAGGHPSGFAATQRRDRWWVGPLLTFLGLSAFGVYTTWRAFSGLDYWAEPYLSPFYSPLIFANTEHYPASPLGHAWFGSWPGWWPGFLPASPAFFILLFPAAFRVTCYYYRKAYYRSFFGTPPGCAVCPMAPGRYHGESRLFVFQNLHRYAMYFAVGFVVVLTYDAILAFFREVEGSLRFGIGVGTVVMIINVFLLSAYTFGCHSVRHLVGGRLNRFAPGGKTRFAHKLWERVTGLNQRHMLFAWLSLFWVAFTDFYILAVAKGWITDLNTWS